MAGVCINIFGIPILEDAACAAARRESRNERKAIEEQSDVDKVEAHEEGHTAVVEARNQPGASGSFTDDLFGFFNTQAGIGGAVGASIFGGDGAGAAALDMYTGGLFSALTGAPDAPPIDPIVPILGVAALGAILFIATRD